jgi:uncharacterized membrane protein YdjX (TVP38/TMEM64 family)
MPDFEPGKPRISTYAVMAAFAGLCAIVVAGVLYGLVHEFDAGHWVRRIEEIIDAWGPWGILISVALMVLHSFVPFPAEFLAMANGMLYGPVLGTFVTWLGAMLGALLAFGLSRWLGRRFVERMFAGQQLHRIEAWTDERAVHWVFLARFVPVIAFNLVNYAAGLTRIGWWTFTWTTAVGIIPMTALMVTMGASVHHMEWQWWLALLAGGFLAWFFMRRLLLRFDRSSKAHIPAEAPD